jgi:prolyl-tRNA synthetase
MRLSQLFTKTSKNVPADETSKNAQLLIQAGYVYKEMAGVYAYLPLGIRVLENIKQIVREEMNAIGGQELIMTSLQNQAVWEQTDRWDDEKVDVWFKSELKNGTPVGFGWSHEEPMTIMMKNYLTSYRDLPASVYQFQTKLRNELRAKSGIMRGREFVMKDLYSYAKTDEEHQKFYDEVTAAYLRVFERAGIGDKTFLTFASGGAFTQFSHEFQTLTDAGEDIIYIDRSKNIAVNEEVLTDDVIAQLGLNRDNLEQAKAAEVGNIFSFGTTKSEPLGLSYAAEDGSEKFVVMGSYGIGITRLMGVIVELLADDKGLVWPENIAPAKVIISQLGDAPEVVKKADVLYETLTNDGISVLYDDRDIRAGEKFADADLLGIPIRVVVSEKSLGSDTYETKGRTSDTADQLTIEQLVQKLSAK